MNSLIALNYFCVGMLAHACTPEGQRATLGLFFCRPPSYVLTWTSLTEPRAQQLARLASEFHHNAGLWCMTHTWLYVCAGHLNSGPHAWAASTLSSQPSFRLLNVLISFYIQTPQQTFQPASIFSPKSSLSFFILGLSIFAGHNKKAIFLKYLYGFCFVTHCSWNSFSIGIPGWPGTPVPPATAS